MDDVEKQHNVEMFTCLNKENNNNLDDTTTATTSVPFKHPISQKGNFILPCAIFVHIVPT